VCSPLIFISSFTDDYHGVSVAPKRELGDFCQKAIMNNVTVWAPGCFLQSSIASSPTQCDCALFASHYQCKEGPTCSTPIVLSTLPARIAA
jgi:hypothetical protein